MVIKEKAGRPPGWSFEQLKGGFPELSDCTQAPTSASGMERETKHGVSSSFAGPAVPPARDKIA